MWRPADDQGSHFCFRPVADLGVNRGNVRFQDLSGQLGSGDPQYQR
jgi:hypothetical protein